MKNIEDIKKIIKENRKTLESEFSVKEIAIFGSYITGDQAEGSDLDILVEFSKPIGLFHFIELEEYLSNTLGVKVDLVSKKALKPRIGRNILQEMVPV
ncbi:MAG: nucleotidyltransferase family protein [Actinobacteria bacterium]|nr:nucleotidyltransferase family protein [Actinomycetota bacterium]